MAKIIIPELKQADYLTSYIEYEPTVMEKSLESFVKLRQAKSEPSPDDLLLYTRTGKYHFYRITYYRGLSGDLPFPESLNAVIELLKAESVGDEIVIVNELDDKQKEIDEYHINHEIKEGELSLNYLTLEEGLEKPYNPVVYIAKVFWKTDFETARAKLRERGAPTLYLGVDVYKAMTVLSDALDYAVRKKTSLD
jgi:hypothetical protein